MNESEFENLVQSKPFQEEVKRLLTKLFHSLNNEGQEKLVELITEAR